MGIEIIESWILISNRHIKTHLNFLRLALANSSDSTSDLFLQWPPFPTDLDFPPLHGWSISWWCLCSRVAAEDKILVISRSILQKHMALSCQQQLLFERGWRPILPAATLWKEAALPLGENSWPEVWSRGKQPFCYVLLLLNYNARCSVDLGILSWAVIM